MKSSILKPALAEFIGTFSIVFYGCGAVLSLANNTKIQIALHGGDHIAINLIFGLVVSTMIYVLGHVSSAHFNPAVTLAFAFTKKFEWNKVPAYLLAQFTGAAAASGVHFLLFPDWQRGNFGATTPSISPISATMLEGILTFFLMFVIMSVATDSRFHKAISGIAIGSLVCLSGLFAGPLTGNSLNPARSLGPAIFASGLPLQTLWIYFVGPIVGACLGALTYEFVASQNSTQEKESS
jgi:MIP family channel proteins